MVAGLMRTIILFSVGLVVAACGGAAAPKAPEPAASPEAKPAEAAAGPAPVAAAKSGGTIEDQRESFVSSCLERARSKDYCDCGFEQFKQVFKDADLSKPLADNDPRLPELKQKTATVCTSKLSEADVKADFVHGCSEGDARKDGYCGCAWGSLRKKLAYTDFVALDANDPRFVAQRKVMVVECKGKYPTEIAKFDFMKACTQGDSAAETACTCKWNKLKKQFTTEELVAGTVDPRSPKGLADCK